MRFPIPLGGAGLTPAAGPVDQDDVLAGVRVGKGVVNRSGGVGFGVPVEAGLGEGARVVLAAGEYPCIDPRRHGRHVAGMPEVVNSPFFQVGVPMDATLRLLKVGRC